jgi:hypothetical protein
MELGHIFPELLKFYKNYSRLRMLPGPYYKNIMPK